MIWQAIEMNEWILLDEINLAPAETLFKLHQLLTEDYIYLMDSNELEILEKPSSFRIFACMNPAFEIGKKQLPPRIKETFTIL